VRSYLPRIIKKTELILAGRTKVQMFDAIAAAIDKKELPGPETGAMCYMLSKQGYLNETGTGVRTDVFPATNRPLGLGRGNPEVLAKTLVNDETGNLMHLSARHRIPVSNPVRPLPENALDSRFSVIPPERIKSGGMSGEPGETRTPNSLLVSQQTRNA
jgi:hypothetical protein